MEFQGRHRSLEKPVTLHRIGCSLVVVALVLLLIITTTSAMYSPLVAAYSYILLGLGIALGVTNKILETLFFIRLKRRRVLCRNCGWAGTGEAWYRSECCPECDAEDVVEVG